MTRTNRFFYKNKIPIVGVGFAVAVFSFAFAFSPLWDRGVDATDMYASEEIDALALEFNHLPESVARIVPVPAAQPMQKIDTPAPATLLKPAASSTNEKGKGIPILKSRYRVAIPKIGVDMPIVEGQDGQKSLRLGLWHIPGTGDPARGGNLAVAGHRYLRTRGPETLFRLDEVRVGDSVSVTWNGVEYTYQVVSTDIVTPDRVDVLDPTAESTLTIITCHPKYSTAKRLVVVAKPVL